jgi:NAD(P)-dependent dehydrogenase (short-subunit alcohol dehydrogenase family)
MTSASDRSVLIVGAGPRLGAAIARRFGRDGYRVGLVARSQPTVDSLVASLTADGIRSDGAAVDVSDPGALHAALTRLAEAGDGVAVAVHNVSAWRDASVLELTPQQLFDDLAAGTASLLTLAQAVVPFMTAASGGSPAAGAAGGGGTIIATGSAAADSPSPGAPSLGVQKAGLRSLIQAMALELTPLGIHCASVTVNGFIAEGTAFDPGRIAEVYADLVAETSGPREAWRTVVPFNG